MNNDNPRLSLDPREYGVQVEDVVRFSDGGFEWLVDKLDYVTNTAYVTSIRGKRQAIEQITQVQSLTRDPTFIPPRQFDYENDPEESDE